MILPNADRAIVDVEKIAGYCLSPHHPVGKHKARVFESALGLKLDDSPILIDALLRAAKEALARKSKSNEFGDCYTIDFEMERGSKKAILRSVWIIKYGTDVPRLVSCYVL